MATHHREVEMKLEPPEGAELPTFEAIPRVASTAAPLELALEAEYFDTAGLALAAAGISLRRRSGGVDDGWHLKAPAGDARAEVQLPLDGSRAVPAALRDAVRLHSRDEPLDVVVRLRTRRRLVRLTDADGRELVEIADDDVVAAPADDASPPIAWREWEAELVDGDADDLEAVVAVLERAGATPAAHGSKLVRALGERVPRSGGASAPGMDDAALDASARDVVLARLREQHRALLAQDVLARLGAPDAVHRMRVAVRRVRAALATFRPLLDAARTKPVRAELRWLARALGEERDAEVLLERLSTAAAELPAELAIGAVASRIDDALRARSRAARERTLDPLDSERWFALADALSAIVAHPPWRAGTDAPDAEASAAELLRPLVRRELRRTRRRLERAAAAPPGARHDELLHEARKAAKRARYAVESLEPVDGEPASRLARSLARVQSVLGEHHDAVVAAPVLRELGMRAHLGGDNAFSYGLLAGHERARALAAESELGAAWARARAKRRRRWLE